MPSGMRSSNASGSQPRRSRAASSRTSPPSIAARATPEPRATSMSRPRLTAAAWTDTPRAGRLRPAAVAAVLALLLGLAGCGGGDDQNDQVVGSTRVSSADAMAQEQRILGQRARAVRDHDLGLFLRRVDHKDAALMARQRRYFRNLVQLPLTRFSYKVTSEQWPGLTIAKSWGDDVSVPEVALTMQLARLRRGARRAHGRVRVLLRQRPGDAGLRPHQLRQAAVPRQPGAVGPHRDQRRRGARSAGHLRPPYDGLGGDRDRGRP